MIRPEIQLRNRVKTEVLDFTLLSDQLGDYRRPRDKITRLLKSGVLIRVKKGLYVFGPDWARRPYSKELLANLIYGPSYVSMQSALSHHGVIPERVETVTSVTSQRDKRFHTPLGVFSYRYLNPDRFPAGIEVIRLPDGLSYLMASREKALADLLALDPAGHQPATLRELEQLLFEDLRCDEEAIQTMDRKQLRQVAQSYRHKHVDLLERYLAQRETDV